MALDNIPAKFDGAVIGKYQFLKLLGKGGYASVYLADELDPNRKRIRPVAIKVFLCDTEDREAFRSTFDNFSADLRFLAELASTNAIIQYYTFETYDVFLDTLGTVYTLKGHTDNQDTKDIPLTAFFVVMEFADGGYLDAEYRDECLVRSTDNSYLDHLVDICIGLRAAHDKGIVHRDIKPHNLQYFRKDNRVKIGDFGVADHLDNLTATSLRVVGSLPYMAPECFDGSGSRTPKRDIYALGCTFYELFTGTQAFALPLDATRTSPGLDNPLALYSAMHKSAPRPDAVIHATELLSVRLSGVIKRMMAQEVGSRPTLDDVISVLRDERRATIDIGHIFDASSEVLPPQQPVKLSSYNISPRFRRDRIKETVYFIFLDMEVRTHAKMKLLFYLLSSFFDDTFSLYEVFGEHDFMIRVWSNPNKGMIAKFCEKVIDTILDNNRRALRIMVCDDVTYLPEIMHECPSNLHVMEALVRLNEAQTRNDAAAIKWLVDNRIYARKIQDSVSGSRIKCFCRVSSAVRGSEAERRAQYALITRTIQTSSIYDNRLGVSVYKRTYKDVEGFENDSCSVLIKYVAQRYDDAVRIPAVILDELHDQGLRTSTLLATKRVYVESDKVRTH